MKLRNRKTGEIVYAIYGTTPAGNKRYYIDNKPVSDKTLDRLYERLKDPDLEHHMKVHAALLFEEILQNNGLGIMKIPLLAFDEILTGVAKRCSEINDPILNGFMCRLGRYAISDPRDKSYNPELTNILIDNTKGY